MKMQLDLLLRERCCRLGFNGIRGLNIFLRFLLERVASLTLIERKSRIPQIQGVQGRSRSNLLRALGNEGNGVSSAFPKGKQHGVFFIIPYFTDMRV
jgi:hypothetical protein